MNVAYVRTSTVEQNEARQVEALKQHSIDKWYIERRSGKNSNREKLQQLLNFVREGDVVYVSEFSRLARNTSDILNIVNTLEEKGVTLVSLRENLKTDSSYGRMILTVISAVDQMTRETILENQREGIQAAVKRGRYHGRQKKELPRFDEVYGLWRTGKITAVAASKELGISRYTFYNRVKDKESNAEQL